MTPHQPSTAFTPEELEIRVKGKYQIFGLRLLLISQHFKDSFTRDEASAAARDDRTNGWLVELLAGDGGYGLSRKFVANINPREVRAFLDNEACAIRASFSKEPGNLFTGYVGPECTGKQLTAINQMFVGAESAALAAKLDAQGL